MKMKNAKRSLSFLLSLLLIVGMLPCVVFSASATSEDGKSEETAFIIDNVDELEDLADDVNKGDSKAGLYYKLSSEFNNTGNPFDSRIGKDEKHAFKGTFLGNNKEVNLDINGNGDYYGLFGCIGNGGRVENVIVTGKLSGSGYKYGGIAGANIGGTISNCSSNIVVNVKKADSVGCICGYNYSNNSKYPATIEKCVSAGSVTTIEPAENSRIWIVLFGVKTIGGNSGGTCGYNYSENYGKAIITECVNKASVENKGSSSNTGGIVGYNRSEGNGTSKIDKCINNANVSGKESYALVGGIVGYSYKYGNDSKNIVINCVNNGEVKVYCDLPEDITGPQDIIDSIDLTAAGGVVGFAGCDNKTTDYNSNMILNCCNIGCITGNGLYVGGIIGDSKCWLENCFNRGIVNSSNPWPETYGGYGDGRYIGGVSGVHVGGTIEHCYYDNSIQTDTKVKNAAYNESTTIQVDVVIDGETKTVDRTIGVANTDNTTVKGLTTDDCKTEATLLDVLNNNKSNINCGVTLVDWKVDSNTQYPTLKLPSEVENLRKFTVVSVAVKPENIVDTAKVISGGGAGKTTLLHVGKTSLKDRLGTLIARNRDLVSRVSHIRAKAKKVKEILISQVLAKYGSKR